MQSTVSNRTLYCIFCLYNTQYRKKKTHPIYAQYTCTQRYSTNIYSCIYVHNSLIFSTWFALLDHNLIRIVIVHALNFRSLCHIAILPYNNMINTQFHLHSFTVPLPMSHVNISTATITTDFIITFDFDLYLFLIKTEYKPITGQ